MSSPEKVRELGFFEKIQKLQPHWVEALKCLGETKPRSMADWDKTLTALKAMPASGQWADYAPKISGSPSEPAKTEPETSEQISIPETETKKTGGRKRGGGKKPESNNNPT